MKPLLIFLLFTCITANTFSQSDLLVLKERNKTIKTWIPGSIINFQYSSKQWIEGIVKSVRHDSVMIEQIVIQTVANQFGLPTVDTAKFGLMKFHVNEIYGMPKNDNAGIFTNGALFQLGSAAFIVLNIANTLIHNDQLFSASNVTRLSVAGGFFLLGTILAASHKTYITLGKKYRMETIHTQ